MNSEVAFIALGEDLLTAGKLKLGGGGRGKRGGTGEKEECEMVDS